MSKNVLFSLPDQLAARMKASIPSRERSKVIAKLLEQELNALEDRLYLFAKELEESHSLKEEILIWEDEYGQDGL